MHSKLTFGIPEDNLQVNFNLWMKNRPLVTGLLCDIDV